MSADAGTDLSIRPPSRLAVLGISTAAGLVPLNSTMIAVAVPEIADDFDISIGRVSVLVAVYLIIMLVGQPIAGRLADRAGPHRALRIALVGFAIFSVAAAMTTSFPLLVVARAAQAAFGTFLVPGVQALLRLHTGPDQMGQMFGLLGAVIGIGAATGPVIGGVATQLFGWEAIFLVNVPLVIVGFAATVPYRAGADRSRVGSRASVAEGGRILNRTFLIGFSVQALTTQAQYTLLLLTPVILTARIWSTGSIGLALSALTVGGILAAPFGGRLGDRYGRRRPAVVSIGICLGAVVLLLVGGSDVAPVLLIVALAGFGVGFGGSNPNVVTAALESIPEGRTGTGSGILSMSRHVGSIPATIIFSAVVAVDASGTRSVLAISALAVMTALVVAAGIADRPSSLPPVDRRATDQPEEH